MNLRKLLLIIPAFLLLLGSCKNIPDHTKYIPEDAMAVVAINTKELSKDVAWSVLKGTDLFKKIQQKKRDSSDGFRFEKSGIDILNTSFLYTRMDARYGNQYRPGMQKVLLVPLKSAKDFEAEMKRIFPNKQIEEVDGRKVLEISHTGNAIWTKDILIITDKAYNMSDEDYKTVINEIFNVKKSLGSDKKFKALQAENHDIYAWINYETLGKLMMDNSLGMGGAGAILGSLAATEKMLKGTIATIGVDFEDGEIVANVKYYPSNEMKDLYKDMYRKPDAAFLDMLPKDNINGITAMSISPDGMLKYIDKMGVKGMLNLELAKQDLSVEDLLSSFTGDIVISVNNFRSVQKPNPMAAYYPEEDLKPYYDYEMDFVYGMKLKNKATIQKVLALTKGMADSVDENTYYIKDRTDTICLKLTNEYLVVSNNISVANGFVNGSYKGGNQGEAYKYVANADFGAFVDIQSFLQQVRGSDSAKMAMVQGLFKDLKMKSSGIDKDVSEGEMRLTFQNQKENSLLQLINFFGQID